MSVLQVGVQEATFKGRVRLTMRPLLNVLPVVGAIQVRTSRSARVR